MLSAWLRIAAVIVLLGVAAAIVTPKGRIPLALRGLARVVGRRTAGEKPSVWRRMAALLLVLAALLLALV